MKIELIKEYSHVSNKDIWYVKLNGAIIDLEYSEEKGIQLYERVKKSAANPNNIEIIKSEEI